jgi:hypothetical protein
LLSSSAAEEQLSTLTGTAIRLSWASGAGMHVLARFLTTPSLVITYALGMLALAYSVNHIAKRQVARKADSS